MANKKGIRMQLEIKRLKELGHGKKTIARILKVSVNTVRRYWENGLEENKKESYSAPWSEKVDWKLLDEAVSRGQSLFDWHENLSGRGNLLDGITYSSFWREYRRRHPKIDLIFHKNYPPGERMEADYKGREKLLGYLDRANGHWVQLELFGDALCFSQLFYAEATENQKQEHWLLALEHSFHYFGGVTETIGVDNATVSVKRADCYDPDVNPEFWKFSEHFNFSPIPTRPSSPTHKAIIENLLGVFWRWIRPKIKLQQFFSKAEVNQFLWENLEYFNNRIQRKYGKSRRQRFEEGEKTCLKKLPETVYEYGGWQTAKLHPDCHLQVKKNFYSAPYKLRGMELEVRVSQSFIEVFHRLEKVAIHKKLSDSSHGRYSTQDEHLPESHKAIKEFTPKRAIDDAKNIGKETHTLVERLLTCLLYTSPSPRD